MNKTDLNHKIQKLRFEPLYDENVIKRIIIPMCQDLARLDAIERNVIGRITNSSLMNKITRVLRIFSDNPFEIITSIPMITEFKEHFVNETRYFDMSDFKEKVGYANALLEI